MELIVLVVSVDSIRDDTGGSLDLVSVVILFLSPYQLGVLFQWNNFILINWMSPIPPFQWDMNLNQN